MKNKVTYTATASDGEVIYSKQPSNNLWGMLPLGAHMLKGDIGSLDRVDGGDQWDGAKFHLESGRTIIIARD